MKKKKIISSLMLTGIVLSSVNPMVVLADEIAETQSAQNTPSSQTATNDTSTSEYSLSQVGLDTQSSVLTENSEQTKNTENLTTHDDVNDHIFGNRLPDQKVLNGHLGHDDQIRVDSISQIKNGSNYTVNINGTLMAETSSRKMTVTYETSTGVNISSVSYKPKSHHPISINSFSSTQKVGRIIIKVEHTSDHYVDAVYDLTSDELPADTKPVINAADKTVKVGDTFDPKAGVTATDAEDGNLTSKIQVVSNNVDTTKAGVYQVTYAVTDADGNTVEKTITVTVKENNKPVINAADKTVKVGDTFDPKADVTATDAEDGDLTSKIEVKENTVDTTKAGEYQVTYTVTDADGNTVEKTIQVTVKENNKPVINASDKTLKVGDTFDPKADVTATDAEDGDLTSKIEVKENTVDTTKAGSYQVTYTVTDADGNTVKKTITVTVIANQGTITPDDYDLSNNHRKITGSYDGDVATVQVELNGEGIPGNGTLKDGKFEYYIGTRITSITDKVFVIAYDKQGKQLDKQQVSVTKSVTKGTVKPNEFSLAKDNKITGSYSGDVAEIDLQVNGTILPGKGSFKDGSFSYYVNKNITSEKDEVYVIALNREGQVLDKEKVNLEGTSGTFTVDPYKLNTNKITGTFTGNVAYFKVQINDNEPTKGGTLSGNEFSFYVGHSITSAKDKVVITAFDKNNKQLDQKELAIAAE